MNRTCAALSLCAFAAAAVAEDKPTPVSAGNFVRAETDMYFSRAVKGGAIGQLKHTREPTPIDQQTVVRMNRDTLYSSGVFDLDAGPVTITLPDSGKRFMSLQVVSQDHYTGDVVYAPGRFAYDRAKVGTRYMMAIVRTLVDAQDRADVQAAQRVQDAIRVEQAAKGRFEVPQWDAASQAKARQALEALGSLGGMGSKTFGRKEDVDPVAHLIGTARGWGGNPPAAAVYQSVTPKANDGKTVHRLVAKDVPVDGFWSISVYNAQGFFEKNSLDAYSLNNQTAKLSADGSITVQFGGCESATRNCLPIAAGWNYAVRLYRPRKPILDGSWTMPEAQPVQ